MENIHEPGAAKAEQSRADGDLLRAVVAVCSDVLGLDTAPDDEFSDVCQDLYDASHIVGLLNQWLGCTMVVSQLFQEGTPRRLAAALHGTEVPHFSPEIRERREGQGTGTAATENQTSGEAPWRKFWETTYRFSGPEENGGLNKAGWFSSRTLTPLPDDYMREWVDTTSARIASLEPRSILDVGCGVGLFLFELGPRCSRYTGTDFSVEAVERTRERLEHDGALSHIDVLAADARDTARLVDGPYDLVLLNSVVQYFPNMAYLREVLTGLVDTAGNDGIFFLGDIRNRDLHRAAHLSLVRGELPPGTPVERVRSTVERSMAQDPALLIGPTAMAETVAGIGPGLRCHTLVRRGSHPSEMNRFRYDAVLSSGTPARRTAQHDVRWDPATAPRPLVDLLTRAFDENLESLLVRGAPDARNFVDARLAETIDAAPAGTTLEQAIKATGSVDQVDPEDVWELGGDRGYGVAVAPSADPGYVDIALCGGGDDWAAAALLP